MTNPTSDRKTEGARRRRGFQRAGAMARKAVDRIAGKQGFAEADVLLNWPAIAGEALAATCQPVKVSYARERTLGATLIVQTNSARAPEIEMKGPMIVERVNQYYGYRAIRRLKVTQSTGLGRASGFAEGQATFLGVEQSTRTQNAPAPTDTEHAEGARLASNIQSPGLRDQIALMGANILARDRSRTDEQNNT